jgi:hypothetical protein
MLFAFGVWVIGVILISPILIFGLAWAKTTRFYRNRQVPYKQKFFYLAALIGGSVSTLAYVGYWSFRVGQLYHITFPLLAQLAIDRLIYASQLFCTASLVCLLFGRGPYRVPLALATLWVMFQLWVHGGIIHWA